MKKILIALIVPLLGSLIAEAQQNPKIEKADFKLEEIGFEDAWYNIKEGDRCYNLGGGLYSKAALHYSVALEFNSENAALNYKMGVSSLLGNDMQGALPYFLKARSLDMDVAEDIVLLTGRAYQYRGDYGKAIDFFNMYSDMGIESGKIDPIVNVYINECNMAIESGDSKEAIEIYNMGNSINSGEDDYAPAMSRNEQVIYFTTRRNLDEKEKLQRSDMKWNENIFLATLSGDNWVDAGPAGKELSTPMNEGVLYVDNENTRMYIYAGWVGNGDILVTSFENGKWTTPVSFNDETSTPFRETSFAVTASGDEMFFTSDRRKGNFGGRDIYSARRIKKKKWTKPINLGPLVNSDKNEEAVWASATGDTIWYSSNGHTGFGGYDIFMAVRDEKGIFSEPVNMGLPVNSQWNDIFYRQSVIDRRVAWFSSNRPGGNGGLDIYKAVKVVAPVIESDTLILPHVAREK